MLDYQKDKKYKLFLHRKNGKDANSRTVIDVIECNQFIFMTLSYLNLDIIFSKRSKK